MYVLLQVNFCIWFKSFFFSYIWLVLLFSHVVQLAYSGGGGKGALPPKNFYCECPDPLLERKRVKGGGNVGGKNEKKNHFMSVPFLYQNTMCLIFLLSQCKIGHKICNMQKTYLVPHGGDISCPPSATAASRPLSRRQTVSYYTGGFCTWQFADFCVRCEFFSSQLAEFY